MIGQVNFFTWLPWRWWRLRQCSHLLIGGGGLIQDTFSTATLMRSAFDAAVAVWLGKPYHLVGLEVGSVYHQESKERTRFVVRNARSAWCRDPASADRLQSFATGSTVVVRQMPDLAHDFLRRYFALPPAASADTGHCIYNPLSMPRKHPEEFVRLVHGLCSRFVRVTLAAAQPGEEATWLSRLGPRPSNLEIFVSGDWEPPLKLLRGASVLVAERFHYLAAGAHAGLHVVPVAHTAKAQHLALEFGLESTLVDGDSATADVVLSRLDSLQPVSRSRLESLAACLRQTVAEISSQSDRGPSATPAQRAEARRVARSIFATSLRDKAQAARRRLGLAR